jgi:hypothetical protein
MSGSIFDLLDEMAAELKRREFAQRVAAMPDWEKQFLLGYLQYTEAHPEVLDPPTGENTAADEAPDEECPEYS